MNVVLNKTQDQRFLKFLQESKTFYTSLYQVLDRKFYSFSSKYQVVWQQNNTRLLKFTSSNVISKTSPVLFIPSLINPGYILDIMQNYSLVEIVSSQSTCYLIDWGDPTTGEANYKFGDYYTNKVAKILKLISKEHKQKVNLVGYCLGGIFSILSAAFDINMVGKLALLACPWDFSCYRHKVSFLKNFIDYLLETQELISSHAVRNFFLSFSPAAKIYKKFMDFSLLELNDPKRDLFLRVEKWSLDNMFISRGVMKEILYDFVLQNALMNNSWMVCEKRIDLKMIKAECFFVSGETDVLVPYISTQPLIKQLQKQAYRLVVIWSCGYTCG